MMGYKIGDSDLAEAFRFCQEVFKIPRAIVSRGNLESLQRLESFLTPPLQYIDIPSGSDFNGWTVPNNWNLKSASLINPQGSELIDLSRSNLFIGIGSISIDVTVSLEDLLKHIHTRPDLPGAIPYVTSYYQEDWRICLPYEVVSSLPQGDYRVRIFADHSPGIMRLGEIKIPGAEKSEIFFSTYFCHPQMANNELSGPALWMLLANHVWKLSQKKKLKNSYRFFIGPETIGAIHYLKENLVSLKTLVRAGFVLTCVGADGPFVFMPSRKGSTLADRVMRYVLKKYEHRESSFTERGSDERHWCSPAVDLPVCSVMTKKYHEYSEYHTSFDDLDFISVNSLSSVARVYEEIITILEENSVFINSNVGEPKLDRYGIYPKVNDAGNRSYLYSRDILNVLAYLDGDNDTLRVAEILNLDFHLVNQIVSMLHANGLISKCH